MARIVIREQDLTGNRVDQDFTDIAFIPGFVKYPKEEYTSPQLCYNEEEFIEKFGNEPAITNSRFSYGIDFDGSTVLNPDTGTEMFYLDSKDFESISDSAYHYARELLYRGLPIYYCPMNAYETEASESNKFVCDCEDASGNIKGKMKRYDGTQNLDPAHSTIKFPGDEEVEGLEADFKVLPKGYAGDEEVSIIKQQSVEKLVSLEAEPNKDMEYKIELIEGGGVKSQTIPFGASATFTVQLQGTNIERFSYKWFIQEEGKDKQLISTSRLCNISSLLYAKQADPDALDNAGFTKSKFAVPDGEGFKVIDVYSNGEAWYTADGYIATKASGDYELDGISYPKYELSEEADEDIAASIKASKDAIVGIANYKISVEITGTKSSAEALGTIKVIQEGNPLTVKQVYAIAKAKAVDAATAIVYNTFTKEMIDFFKNTENTELIKDRGLYNFKYMTTGGYPLFEAALLKSDGRPKAGYSDWAQKGQEISGWEIALSNLLEVVGQKTVDDSKDYISDDGSTQRQGRGDCVLLIDHTLDKCQDTMDLYEEARIWFENPANVNDDALEFAAMFTPWCNYGMTYTSHNVDVNLPASFAYLSCLADSIQAYDNWHAISGVTRGTVKNINEILLQSPLTNTKANKCQADPETAEKGRISINCITEIKPYGQVIWGNRTMQKADAYKHVTAMGFLNLRNEVSDIKKLVYRAARRWMFEQNTSVLWVNFKSTITPLLERMVNGYGLSRYEIRKGAKTAKHKLYAEIRIWPIYAVEYIDVTIQILDEETIVTEE